MLLVLIKVPVYLVFLRLSKCHPPSCTQQPSEISISSCFTDGETEAQRGEGEVIYPRTRSQKGAQLGLEGESPKLQAPVCSPASLMSQPGTPTAHLPASGLHPGLGLLSQSQALKALTRQPFRVTWHCPEGRHSPRLAGSAPSGSCSAPPRHGVQTPGPPSGNIWGPRQLKPGSQLPHGGPVHGLLRKIANIFL